MNNHIDEAYLKATAVKCESRTVPVHLSDDELADYRATVADAVIAQQDADSAFADVKAAYREDRKQRTEQITKATKVLRNGYVEDVRLCYDVPDGDTGTMKTYDASGKLISTRRLKSSERQLTIHTMPQRASNEGAQ